MNSKMSLVPRPHFAGEGRGARGKSSNLPPETFTKPCDLQEVYRTITANTRLQLLTDRVRRHSTAATYPPTAPSNRSFCPRVTPFRGIVRLLAQRQFFSKTSGLVVVDIDHLDPLTKPPGCAASCLKTRFKVGAGWSSSAPADRGKKAFVPLTDPDPPAGCAPERRRKHPMGHGLRAVRVCRR